MNEEGLKKAYLNISESLDVAARELEMKATVLRRIQGVLYNQASDSIHRDTQYSINPENLFDTIRRAIKEYEEAK